MQLSSNLYLLIDIMDPLCKYMVKYNIIEFSLGFLNLRYILFMNNSKEIQKQ